MMTQFVSLEVQLPATSAQLESAIVQAVQRHGEPLRWAVTAVDAKRRIALVEAVITISTVLA
ncbi:hypothetical protein ACQ4M4_23270 [Leptolyngbya sp. AN02str]|uniref:hypothetical protein n=1 Tax=Leptolyngbya sp. AN02str TaxID=3423363 RepID=UPI003D32107F